jgi:hypothetical protein
MRGRFNTLFRYSLIGIVFLIIIISLFWAGNLLLVRAQEEVPLEPNNEYFIANTRMLDDGNILDEDIINGPPTPPEGYELERVAVELSDLYQALGTHILAVPAYDWSFGCSATSGAMIAGYYDRTGFPDMYTGPTNGGVMPMDNSSWPKWNDGNRLLAQNPLAASRQGLDGRTTRGSIDDYWVAYESAAQDPYLTNGWKQHTWGDAIGDYMKTSQSAFENVDGSTRFFNNNSAAPLTCAEMESAVPAGIAGANVSDFDGTYGRKLFYEARGYTVTDCYNQKTDNNISGGFSFTQFKAEIDAGRPVMVNLEGHTIVGVGYNDSSDTIYIHDTWDYETYAMTWGGSYKGMVLRSVSIVNIQSSILPFSYQIYLPLVLRASTGSPPSESIANGDFESGPLIWTEFSYQDWHVIVSSSDLPVTPHSGSYATWLGGDYDEISYIQQQVAISSSTPYLVYWQWIASEDSCSYDFGGVLINGMVVDEYSLCETNNTGGWVTHSVNLGSYAGQSVSLQIRAETDSIFNSNLFIDDVSLQASASTLGPTHGVDPDLNVSASQGKIGVLAQGEQPQITGEKRFFNSK